MCLEHCGFYLCLTIHLSTGAINKVVNVRRLLKEWRYKFSIWSKSLFLMSALLIMRFLVRWPKIIIKKLLRRANFNNNVLSKFFDIAGYHLTSIEQHQEATLWSGDWCAQLVKSLVPSPLWKTIETLLSFPPRSHLTFNKKGFFFFKGGGYPAPRLDLTRTTSHSSYTCCVRRVTNFTSVYCLC